MKKPDTDRQDLEDPLGIARQPVTPDPSIHAGNDDASRRRRRERALGTDEEEPASGLGDRNTDLDGAAGIDMGYGGEGTDIKPSR
jgi:hypothetical protein